MSDFCPWRECRNLYQVWIYWLWTRLDRRRNRVVVCPVYECRCWQVCASFPRCPLKSVKSSQEFVVRSHQVQQWVDRRKDHIPSRCSVHTKGTVFSLRLSVMSGTLSLIGLQWKEAGGLWVSVLPSVHEVLNREQNRKVVYLLFNGSVLLPFGFVDESETMFIRSLMGWSTSWGRLSVSDVPTCCRFRIFRISWHWDVAPPHQSY